MPDSFICSCQISNTTPAFFFASNRFLIFCVRRTAYSTIDLPSQNPACSQEGKGVRTRLNASTYIKINCRRNPIQILKYFYIFIYTFSYTFSYTRFLYAKVNVTTELQKSLLFTFKSIKLYMGSSNIF